MTTVWLGHGLKNRGHGCEVQGRRVARHGLENRGHGHDDGEGAVRSENRAHIVHRMAGFTDMHVCVSANSQTCRYVSLLIHRHPGMCLC